MRYWIGIDVSTTATKALLMDEQGKVVAVASSTYETQTPNPLWSEQHPHLWWQATQKSLQKVFSLAGINGKEVEGVGLTGQMHGLVLLDKNGEVLRPAILWNDQRTGSQCEQIRNRVGKERLVQITGNDALAGFTAPKILWVAQNEPEIFRRIAHILLPKDYVRYCLTQEYALDRAGGAGTILFELKERTWSPEILSALEINPDWLPPTFEGPAITGIITPEAASATGLKPGTPVMAGGGDQAAAAVGTGAVKEGLVSVSLGTSGVVFATTNHPVIESSGILHSFCHAVPGKWHLMGVMLSAAGSLRWHRDTFAPSEEFSTLVESCTQVPAGSDGLFFLPYLTGERTPYPDPLARGAFVGLTIRHTLPMLTRAVLEGVAYGLKDCFELMKKAGLPPTKQVRVTGGGGKSPLWRQILADVLQSEIVMVNTEEGAAFGAALLAATGSGLFENIEQACLEVIQVIDRVFPGNDQQVYTTGYQVYHNLYPALRHSFQAIGEQGN